MSTELRLYERYLRTMNQASVLASAVQADLIGLRREIDTALHSDLEHHLRGEAGTPTISDMQERVRRLGNLLSTAAALSDFLYESHRGDEAT